MFRIELNFLVIFPNTKYFLSSILNTLVLFEKIPEFFKRHMKTRKQRARNTKKTEEKQV